MAIAKLNGNLPYEMATSGNVAIWMTNWLVELD